MPCTLRALFITIVLIGIVLVSSTLSAQGVGTSKRSESPPNLNLGVGRYVAIQPPAAGEHTMDNFMWVLDTYTGDMRAYRIVNIKDDSGKVQGWVTERLPWDTEYRVREIERGIK